MSDETPPRSRPTAALGATSQREAVKARFSEWLDEAWVDDEPPPGLPAELVDPRGERGGAASGQAARECDLLSLWSAMTALGQEVKLQGRTFHALERAIAPLPAAVEGLRESTHRLAAPGRRELEERAFSGVLELLLDLRERLRHGLDAARAHVRTLEERTPRPIASRLAALVGVSTPSSAAAEAAFARGYELTLERLDEALAERGVTPIECLGHPFDPRRMRAVEVVEGQGRAEGSVVGVQRGGFERGGEVLRFAEVTVVRGGAR